ncbi:hypothetical protein GX50_05816 [[Emmonsia] crescens]|uniref:Zn(2)-C6 fungal-type domain-containing protein n=1 Tax=[Emmonsia] crescens TaxID=73230 RepID=A0A2B7ZE23_9EURO|nr:hypothetical protein GX50_05816 [Emmonsia crescens]
MVASCAACTVELTTNHAYMIFREETKAIRSARDFKTVQQDKDSQQGFSVYLHTRPVPHLTTLPMDASRGQQHGNTGGNVSAADSPQYHVGDELHRVNTARSPNNFDHRSISPAKEYRSVNDVLHQFDTGVCEERSMPSRIGRGDCARCKASDEADNGPLTQFSLKARGLRCITGPLNPTSCTNCNKIKVPCIDTVSALHESRPHKEAGCIREINKLKQRVQQIEQQQEAIIGLFAGHGPGGGFQPKRGELTIFGRIVEFNNVIARESDHCKLARNGERHQQLPSLVRPITSVLKQILKSKLTSSTTWIGPVPVYHSHGKYANMQFSPALVGNAQAPVMDYNPAGNSFTTQSARNITFGSEVLEARQSNPLGGTVHWEQLFEQSSQFANDGPDDIE